MTWKQLPAIWRQADLMPMEKLVLLALAQHGDAQGFNAYPSQETLAEQCCTTTRTVRRALKALISKELISPHGKGRKGTIRYSINLPISAAKPKQANASYVRPPRTPKSYNPIKEPIYKDTIVIDRFSDIGPMEAIRRAREREG
jgi:hypothetical protein